jgi:hypothetical protein
MRKMTTSEFIAKAKEVHGELYDYSKTTYVNSRTKVCIICPVHGEFWQSPIGHLSGYKCEKCSYEQRKKLIYGKAINDLDEPVKVNGKMTNLYSNWFRMLQRCYGKIHSSAYEKCDVCKDWLNLSNFKKWYDVHFVEGWCLDKDILSGENKIYSPQTCCYIPPEINALFTRKSLGSEIHYDKRYKHYLAKVNKGKGDCFVQFFKTKEEAFVAYKREKEARIKMLADKWKDKIEKRVYDALMEYEIKQ